MLDLSELHDRFFQRFPGWSLDITFGANKYEDVLGITLIRRIGERRLKKYRCFSFFELKAFKGDQIDMILSHFEEFL